MSRTVSGKDQSKTSTTQENEEAIPQPAPVSLAFAGLSFSIDDYSRSQLAKEGSLDYFTSNQQTAPEKSTGASVTDPTLDIAEGIHGAFGDGGVDIEGEENRNWEHEVAEAVEEPDQHAGPTYSSYRRAGKLPSDAFQEPDAILSGSMKLEQLFKDFVRTTITLATTPATSLEESNKISTHYSIDASGLISLEDITEKVNEELDDTSARYISLDMSKNRLGENGLRALAPVLRSLTHLAGLMLADNITVESYITGIEDGRPSGLGFFTELRAWMVPPPSTCLTELDLSGNWMRSEGASQLAAVLEANSLLTSLNLASNNMFCAGVASIAASLSNHCTHLTALYLGVNWIADDGLQALVPALVANSTLTHLSLPQNGLTVEGSKALVPLFCDHFPSLRELDLVDNLMDAAANKILFHPVQLATTVTSLRGLDPGSVGVFFEYVLKQRIDPDIQPESIVQMDLSNAALSEFPPVLLTLTCMTSLDLSNNDLGAMPYIELCGISTLSELGCVGNPRLFCPPLETMEAGGAACMQYLRDSLNEGAFNISVLLIPIGDTESGKSCCLRALASDNNTSPSEYIATVSPELSMWTPAGQENKLNMKVVDLSGRSVYSITHEFFFSRAAVYLFVWRVLEYERFENEGGQLVLEDMVARWVSTLQHTVPNAKVFVVATHVDSVDPIEVKTQCKIVRNAIKGVLARLPRPQTALSTTTKPQTVSSSTSTVKHDGNIGMSLVNDGESFLVSSVRGVGIAALREQIIIVAKNISQYGLPLSETFREFNEALDVERHRNRSVWLDWRSFRTIALQCGMENEKHFEGVVSLMHDLYFIRYSANVDFALQASDEELQSDHLVNTVYLDVEWCASVFKGLIRHERHELLAYFGGRVPGMVTDDKVVDIMAKRFYVHGILHSTLMKYLWPFEPQGGSKDFWRVVMEGGLGKREAEIIPNTVASNQDDYVSIQDVLSNFGVMGAINADEFVVPFIRIGVKDGAIDSRTLDLSDCPFRCMRVYTTCPEHFLRRLATRMMQDAEHSELTSTVSVHFTKGNKLHLSFAHNVARDSILTIRASSRAVYDRAIYQVKRMESWYPGLVLQSVDATDEEDIEYLTMLQPVHVFLSHSSVCAEDARGMASILHENSYKFDVLLSEQHQGKKGSVPECRVGVILVDQAYCRSKRCAAEFENLVQSGAKVVPLLMPDFHFDTDDNGNIDYAKWWPESLPGMAQHDLFIDFRLEVEMGIVRDTEDEFARLQEQGAPRNVLEISKEKLKQIQLDLTQKYKKKLETELVETIVTVLDRWRCRRNPDLSMEGPRDPHSTVPCTRCLSLWLPDIHMFERSAVAAAWDDWKEKEKVRRAAEGKSFSEPFVTCPNGHGHRSSSLLTDPVGFESLLCPTCKADGDPCPHSFPVKLCTEPFRIIPPSSTAEEPSKTQRLPCPVCTIRYEQPISVPLVDIVAPEVFISFQWGEFGDFAQEIALKAAARKLAQAITCHAGVTCWVDCRGPPEVELDPEDEGDGVEEEEKGVVREYWLDTLAAIKQCRTFVAILSDGYCCSRRTRREFDRAVQTRRFIVPVLMPPVKGGDSEETDDANKDVGGEGAAKAGGEGAAGGGVREASTGWLGGAALETWWHHAVRLSRTAAGGGKSMAATWTVLKSFPPISMLGYEEDGTDKDVVYKVLDRLNTGEQIQHDLKRLYRNWHGSRTILLSEILRFADHDTEKNLTRDEQMQARATKLFQEIDENGNGLIDGSELKLALSHLGIHINQAQLTVMMHEADIDGDQGIDLQEFLDVVLGSELSKAQP